MAKIESITAAADSISVSDTLQSADSLQADTATHDTTYVILLEADAAAPLPKRAEEEGDAGAMSWIIAALLLLFVTIAVRFSKNSKYLAAMLREATDTRERGNVFDDTVRESSFMIILNVLWCLSAGVLLYSFMRWNASPGGGVLPDVAGISQKLLSGSRALGMGICIGISICYELTIIMLYAIIGNVFSDRKHTKMWLHGFLAATGLGTLLLFPLALLMLCYPGNREWILITALIGLVSTKIIFICKGFRIFFNQISSLLLFLYYLCSLEIVPLILVYVFSSMLLGIWL